MRALIDRLRKRKLVQWALAYLAGAWVALQALDLLVEAWNLSAATVRALQLAALVGLIGTLVLAWYHGERGRQRLSLSELIILSVLVVMGGVSVGFLHDPAAEPAPDAALARTAADGPALQMVVLPVVTIPPGSDTVSSAAVVQQLLVMELSRRRAIAVIEPNSLNTLMRSEPERSNDDDLPTLRRAGIDYAVRTTLSSMAAGSEIAALLIEVSTGEVLGSSRLSVAAESELPDVIERISTQLMSALEAASGGITRAADLAPFLPARRPNVAATREFMQGIEYSYQMIPGGRKHFERAIELDPAFIAPRVWLVPGLVARGDSAAAAAHVQALTALADRATPFEQALISWADATLRGDLDAKAQHLQVALSYSPRNNVLLFDLAATLYRLERYDEAVAVVRPAVESRWRFSTLFVLWAMASIESGQAEGLRGPLEEALGITPQYPYIYAVLAGLAAFDGDSVAAQRYAAEFSQRLAEHPRAPTELAEVYESLAEIARAGGDRARARRLLQRAIDADPGRAVARLSLARVSAEVGDVTVAEAQYRAARDTAAADAEVLHLMGEVAALLNHRGDAERFLTRYLETAPRGPAAAQVRERLRAMTRR